MTAEHSRYAELELEVIRDLDDEKVSSEIMLRWSEDNIWFEKLIENWFSINSQIL